MPALITEAPHGGYKSIPAEQVAPLKTCSLGVKGRGFDSPLLDILGEGAAAVARVLAGRRPDTFIFDGAIDKDLGLTLSLRADHAGRITGSDLHWYQRRPHLDAAPKVLGLKLGKAPDKLRRPLAKSATPTTNGWTFLEAGVALGVTTDSEGTRWLDTVRATALAAPAALLAKEPLLFLVGGPVDAVVTLLGPPDEGHDEASATWFAPSAHQPTWALRVTHMHGMVSETAVERVR